ncbi:hypothetical protein NE237_005145 [Protea cynaroides]|uniref:Uncharacterized protein n=1 Tax=Protea cynaroides TaxID=273540 RepID=A0A9Q0KKT1_9MAGN|nr:hypothetical protein NE237_005145 [Protea cynaroides]
MENSANLLVRNQIISRVKSAREKSSSNTSRSILRDQKLPKFPDPFSNLRKLLASKSVKESQPTNIVAAAAGGDGGGKSTTKNSRSIIKDPKLPKHHDPFANLRIKMQLLNSKTVKENQSNNIVDGGDGGSGDCNYKSTPSRRLFPNGVKFLFSDVLGGAKKSGIASHSDVFGGVKKSKATFFDVGKDSIDRDVIIKTESDFHFDQNESDDLEFLRSESLSSRSSRDSLNSDQEYFVIKSPWRDAKQNGQQICSDHNLKEIGTTEKDEEEAGEEDEDNKELWKKRILMGKRCQPLNFRDYIHYDENGNRLQEFQIKHSASSFW